MKTITTDFQHVIDELRAADKFLLTTHENPDGDAIGSLVGMYRMLLAMGKDPIMFMRENEFPLPFEYRGLLADHQVTHQMPNDMAERTVVFLDCGNIDRMKVDWLGEGAVHIVNIDHHHDNTRFGSANLVAAHLSCTAEIVYDLLVALQIELTLEIADALYVGLVTDTGLFMYENTKPSSHRMAAALIEAGVDVHAVHRRLHEEQPYGKLQLLARALQSVERYDGGLLTIAHLTRADFDETGSEETYSEGVVDHLRTVAGTAVGALTRELTTPGREHLRKVSLRSTDGRVDVSVIARSLGGGGHRQAAGLTTDKSLEETIELIRAGISEQLAPS